jgi:hypothetical protein
LLAPNPKSVVYSFIIIATSEFISNKTYDLLKCNSSISHLRDCYIMHYSRYLKLFVTRELGIISNYKTHRALKYISLVNLIMDGKVVN